MNIRNIIAIVLGIIVIALVILLMVGDVNDNTVLTISNQKYDVKDFESYVKVWNYENNSAKNDVEKMYLELYVPYKLYATRAEKVGLELEGYEKPKELTSGDELILLEDYALTSGEYMKVQTEIALANKLYGESYKYGKVPQSYYDSYLSAQDKEIFDTFNYRVIEIPVEQDIEEPKLDENGYPIEEPEESGEDSGEKARKEQERIDEAKAKIEAVKNIVKEYASLPSGEKDEASYVEKIKEYYPELYEDVEFSGDLFEYISENSTIKRATQNTNGFNGSKANAALDSAARVFFKNDMTGLNSLIPTYGNAETAKTIVDNVEKLKAGEVSETFETDSGFGFVYLESIVNELSEEDNNRLHSEIANKYIDEYAGQTRNIGPVKKINLEKLIPIVARKAEEAKKAAENAKLSGDGSGESITNEEDNVEELFGSGEEVLEEIVDETAE